jgi:hypothetical protein
MSESATLSLCEDQAEDTRVAHSALAGILETASRLHNSSPHDEVVRELLAQLFTDQARAIFPPVLLLPERARRLWQQLSSVGWAGHATEVHAVREPFRQNIQDKLRLVQQARRFGEMLRLLKGQPFPEEERLRQAEEDLRRFSSEVFDRWETLEDLEDLLAASFPLSNERLEVIGKKYPPSPAWYSEEGKPF